MDILNFLIILCPIFGVLLNVVSQIILMRKFGRQMQSISVAAGNCIGLVFVTVFQAYLTRLVLPQYSEISFLIVNILIYLAFSFCYFAFYNLGVTSLRIRILHEIAAHHDGLRESDLLTRYNEQDIYLARLARLTTMKQVYIEGENYFLGRSLLLIAVNILDHVRWLYFGNKPRK